MPFLVESPDTGDTNALASLEAISKVEGSPEAHGAAPKAGQKRLLK
jgi:hypothetical protein